MEENSAQQKNAKMNEGLRTIHSVNDTEKQKNLKI